MKTQLPPPVNLPLSTSRLVKYLLWVFLALAVFYLAAAWLWRSKFMFGEAPGVYWFLIFLDSTVLPFAAISLIGFIGCAIVLFVQSARHQPKLRLWAQRSGILLIAGVIFLTAGFPVLVSSSTPQGSISVHGRVYHLSLIEALIDANYGLYECDGLGFVCRQIYRSGDYPQAADAKLIYDPSTNTLTINVDGQGGIYVRHPK